MIQANPSPENREPTLTDVLNEVRSSKANIVLVSFSVSDLIELMPNNLKAFVYSRWLKICGDVVEVCLRHDH
jgi:hypothetical protein